MIKQVPLEFPLSIKEFADRLLDWYGKNRRQLPWRADPAPYRVWLSEIMLQQTRVESALPYFRRFLQKFPDLEALARASQQEVVSAWSGLGYYARARNLHRAARMVCEKHAGRFPENYQQALELPGVGTYTAGAVLSIAYGQPYPILDGNIRRVLTRCLRIEEGSRKADSLLRQHLAGMVAHRSVAERISDFNQALMELGALVCTPRRPQCPLCPLRTSCRAHAAGLQEELPRRQSRPKVVRLEHVLAVVTRGERYLLCQRTEGDVLNGLWEFPSLEGLPGETPISGFEKEHGLQLKKKRWGPPVRHQITFRRLTLHPLLAQLVKPAPRERFHWVRPGQDGYPIPSYIGKVLKALKR